MIGCGPRLRPILMLVIQRLWDYLRLMRFDRPVGFLLMLSTVLWSVFIAGFAKPPYVITCICLLGVVVTRAMGCVINDILDRNLDCHVARTKKRPLANQSISIYEAWLIFIALAFIALYLVSLLNALTIRLAVIGFLLIITYPFMKRLMACPQFFMGVVFGAWPILMSFAAIENRLPLIAWLLALAGFFWSVAYDTTYALADKEDDLKIGVQSTAILWGRYVVLSIAIFQLLTLLLLVSIAIIIKLNIACYGFLFISLLLFIYQHYLIRQKKPTSYLLAFINNQWVGIMIFLSIVIGQLH